MERTIKTFMIIIFLIFVALIGLKSTLIFNAKKDGKAIYEIDVNNFNKHEIYMTSEYTRDEQSGCIKFKDEFGIKHIVCNNYTISEY
jgi:hypothetical protein